VRASTSDRGKTGAPRGENRIGVAAIVVQDRLNAAAAVNRILSEYADIIVGRMGVPYKDRGVSVMALILDGDTDTIGAMTGKLGSVAGVKSRVTLVALDGKDGE
jgi:putative iron-only hydrogenase system regulator